MKRLYVVNVTKSFYWYGDRQPSEHQVHQCVRDEGREWDIETHRVVVDVLNNGLNSLVHHDGDDDVTVGEALAEHAAKRGEE